MVLAVARGWPVVAFALAGFVLSVAYTAPPLRLKKRGLGEPDVLVVWGPLMVGGTYYSAVGDMPWQVLLASLPYGLLCTTVLMGKHIDKIPYDEPLGHPHAAGAARRAPRARRDARPAGGVLRLAGLSRAGRRDALARARRAAGAAAAGKVVGAGSAARHRTSRRPASRSGRSGTRRWRGCTCARPAGC